MNNRLCVAQPRQQTPAIGQSFDIALLLGLIYAVVQPPALGVGYIGGERVGHKHALPYDFVFMIIALLLGLVNTVIQPPVL